MSEITQQVSNQVAARIAAALRPKRIYLFGSRAGKSYGIGSDLDLLIVMPDNSGSTLDLTLQAYRATRGLPIARDIIVDHESVFNQRCEWASSIEKEVIKSGRLIYGEP